MNRKPSLVVCLLRPPLVVLKFVVDRVYGILFAGWLDKLMVNRGNGEFLVDIRKYLPFLFHEYGARVLVNDREPPASFDFALVTLSVGDLILRFFRDRGTVTLRVSSIRAPNDSHELSTVLNLLDGNVERPSHLLDIEPVLRAHMDDLRQAFSDTHYAYLKERLSEAAGYEGVVTRQWEREINCRLYD
jgi:hypothetical protein